MQFPKNILVSMLDKLSKELIYDRVQKDISILLEAYRKPYSQMSEKEKTLISMPQKGAYNPSDRNRVSIFCNLFVELMQRFFGTITPDFKRIPTNWGGKPYSYDNLRTTVYTAQNNATVQDIKPSDDDPETTVGYFDVSTNKFYAVIYPTIIPEKEIDDPTEDDLKTYINGVRAIRNKWYEEFSRVSRPSIHHIYTGIDLLTANNIEKALSVVLDDFERYLLPSDPPHCGQMYGTDSGSVVACGNYFYMRK